MIRVEGHFKGTPIEVLWSEGVLLAPDAFVDAAEDLFMQPTLDLGPLTFLDAPSISDEEDAAYVIEFLFDDITSTNTRLGYWQDEHGPSADSIVKHYGPGPHPGTGTEQSVHATGGSGSASHQPQLDEEMFGPRPPTPQTQLTFTAVQDEDSTLLNRVQPLGIEDQLAVRHSVEAWEETFGANTLPDNIEIRVQRSDTWETDGAFAWVKPQDEEPVLYINDDVWNDPDRLDTMLAKIRVKPYSFASGDFLFDTSAYDYEAGIFNLKVTAVFHEVAHLAAADQGWGKSADAWPDSLPFYSGQFYKDQVRTNSPLLPSAYATSSKYEFFAEAMTDVWINGDDAAPMSLTTAQTFAELTS